MEKIISNQNNELNQSLSKSGLEQMELVTAKEQQNFLDTSLGKVVNTAIDLGLRWVLPDFLENQVIDVKNSLIKGRIKRGN